MKRKCLALREITALSRARRIVAGGLLLSAFLFATSLPTASALASQGAPASRYASIVVDAESGAIYYERNADLPRHPASLTKIMTLYLAFEALKEERLERDSTIRVSGHAASREPSCLGLSTGTAITLRDAIRGMTTKSANDAAAAVAEALAGGSEARFAEMMTAKARELGMKQTTFRNASGLPAQGQLSTARDLVILARAIVRDFPKEYRYFSTKSFEYKGKRYPNQNQFLRTYFGADGIKTGYIHASGHNLAASAVRGGRRLVAIVLGGDTQTWTREHAMRLLDVSYAKIDPQLVYVASNAVNEQRSPRPAAVVPVLAATAAGALAAPGTGAAGALPSGTVTAALMTNAGVAVAPVAPPIVVPANPVPAPAAPSAIVPEVPDQAAASRHTDSEPGSVTQPAPVSGEPPVMPTPAAEVAQGSADAQPAQAAPSSADGAALQRNEGAGPATATATDEAGAARSAVKATAVAAVAGSAPGGESASPAPHAPVPGVTEPGATTYSTVEDIGAPVAPDAAIKSRGEWSVQVGLFRDPAVAKKRGEDARGLIPNHLKEADLVVSQAGDGIHLVSRFAQLSEQDAREACSNLQRGRFPCIVIPPGRPLVVANN